MSFGPSVSIGANTFVELDRGHYIDDSTTIDEPSYLKIDSTISENGNSNFLIERNSRKNVVDDDDALLRAYVVIRGNLQDFTEAEIAAHFADLNTFITGTGNLTKILRGEK